MHNVKLKLAQSYKDESRGAKTLSSYKNYLRIVDKPSQKDTTVIIEFEDSRLDSFFTQIEESFKKIRRDMEVIFKSDYIDIDDIRNELYDRLKQIDDKTRDLRNLWLQAKI